MLTDGEIEGSFIHCASGHRALSHVGVKIKPIFCVNTNESQLIAQAAERICAIFRCKMNKTAPKSHHLLT